TTSRPEVHGRARGAPGAARRVGAPWDDGPMDAQLNIFGDLAVVEAEARTTASGRESRAQTTATARGAAVTVLEATSAPDGSTASAPRVVVLGHVQRIVAYSS